MKKHLLRTIPVALLAVMPVKVDAAVFFDNVEQIRTMAPTGTDFNSGLVREYKRLSTFEADEMYDWIDAENHAAKGVMAANGETPMPSDPAEWAIEDPAKRQELELARSSMMSLFDKGGGPRHRSKPPLPKPSMIAGWSSRKKVTSLLISLPARMNSRSRWQDSGRQWSRQKRRNQSRRKPRWRL